MHLANLSAARNWLSVAFTPPGAPPGANRAHALRADLNAGDCGLIPVPARSAPLPPPLGSGKLGTPFARMQSANSSAGEALREAVVLVEPCDDPQAASAITQLTAARQPHTLCLYDVPILVLDVVRATKYQRCNTVMSSLRRVRVPARLCGRRFAAYDSAVSSSLTVRPACVEDVAHMARVNVRSWQETYRGLMSNAVLDDPGFLAARERFWTAALTDGRYRGNRVAVAERHGQLVGIAMSGPPLDAVAAWARQLYVLYVYAADHGTGAGSALLEAVVDPEESAALWVADPNPRAQAFYRKHGFVADGAYQVEDGVREIRMVRVAQHGR